MTHMQKHPRTSQTQHLPPELAGLVDNELRTTSRIIAEKFGKEHRRVLQSIRELDCSEEFARHNFVPFKNKDLTGEHTSHYEITRDGFMFLVMGFTGKAAAQWKEKFIEAFNMMEQIVKSATPAGPNFDDPAFQLGYIQHLTAKVEESKAKLKAQSVQIEAQSEQIRDLAQTELQYERLQSTNHDRLYSFREAKNHLEVKEREFINWLVAAKYIYKPIKKDDKGRPVRKWGGGHKFEAYYLPMAQYDSADGHKGYFVTIINQDEQGNDRPQTKVTQAGMDHFSRLMAKRQLSDRLIDLEEKRMQRMQQDEAARLI